MFEPSNKAHAIIEVLIFIEFSKVPSEILKSMADVQYDLKDEFPAVEPMLGYRVTLRKEDASLEQQQGAIELKRFRPNGDLEWLMRITDEGISIHCLDYTRWATVWKKAWTYFYTVMNRVGAYTLPITSVGLKYIDRFNYIGSPTDYDIKDLINEQSDFVHPKAFRSGPRWHCHTGWYDSERFDDNEILNQLNIDASVIETGLLKGPKVTVDHTAQIRKTKDLSAFGEIESADNSPMSQLMQRLHINNKKVLDNLLSRAMSERINLMV